MHNNRRPNLTIKDFNPYEPLQYGFLAKLDDFSTMLAKNTITIITGKSGLGKSVHALCLSSHRQDAVLIQSTAGLSPHNMVKALCTHLGLTVPALGGSNDARMAHVLANMSQKTPLIILDNAEKLPLDTLALISQLANQTSENKIGFALFGLPVLEQRFMTVSVNPPKILVIQPMQLSDVRNWVNDQLKASEVLFTPSKTFLANLYHQTQGNPRQLARLAPPMLHTELLANQHKDKPVTPKKTRVFRVAAPFVFVLSVFGLSQPILTAKIHPKPVVVTQQAEQKPVDIVTLVEARLTKDEQFVLKSQQDFIQIGATQTLSEMLKWISQKTMTENEVRVVRAMRQSTPFFLVLKPLDSEAPALHGQPWLRKYESIAQDIVAFVKINQPSLLQA